MLDQPSSQGTSACKASRSPSNARRRRLPRQGNSSKERTKSPAFAQGSDPVGVLQSRSSFLLRLSTPSGKRLRRHRQDSRVACPDDIHTPVEKPENSPKKQDKTDKSAGKPPGQFVSNDLEQHTARFIEGVKDLARRRKEVEAEEKQGPPPRPGGNQRSRRR